MVLFACVAAGCASGASSGSGGSTPPTGESEPNDTFPQAHKAVFGDGQTARLAGTIETREDLDVFDLGDVSVGQLITVDVRSETDGFDASVAVFDQEFGLVMDNDDEDLAAGILDPYLEHTVRHGGERYFLVVGRSAFAGFSPEVGEYRATVRVAGSGSAPDPKRQTVYLDFEGGEIEPDNLLVSDVRPFDAATIDPVYAGQDATIKQGIIETVRQNYEVFDVVVVTDAADLPADDDYSIIMFGSYSARAFGISESVDHYNGDSGDMAVIFAESFTPDQFEAPPTAEQLGVAIGNIAAHEAGHLLGLNHVDDPTALMDAVSPADTFLADQEFKIAQLSGDILPIGYQDSPLLLSETVGLLEGFTLSRPTAKWRSPAPRLRDPDASSWCATCNRKLGQ